MYSFMKIFDHMLQDERAELFRRMIDVIEDFLEEKGITPNDIPNEERDQDDIEDSAIIYGSDYNYLVDRFSKILEITRYDKKHTPDDKRIFPAVIGGVVFHSDFFQIGDEIDVLFHDDSHYTGRLTGVHIEENEIIVDQQIFNLEHIEAVTSTL